MVCLFLIDLSFIEKKTFLEQPRFINLSNSLQIAAYYSTVSFICQVYGVPTPIVTWYKILEKNKQTIENEDLQLLSVDSEQYV
jgi:hypothetical protein